MRLSEARLCLDCDEIHADARCPRCASESFAFIKRWVVTGEKRPRSTAAPENEDAAETVATYRALLNPDGGPHSGVARLLRKGAVGLAVLGAAGWLLQRNIKPNGSPARPEPGSRPDRPDTSASS